MVLDRGRLLTALFSLGAAAAVFPLLPAAWPNPLPDGPVAQAALPRLRAAAQAVDAACRSGDLAAWTDATTPAHRGDLARRLAALDRRLDADTLRALGADAALADWLDRPVLAGEVDGDRIAVVVARAAGDGAQLLAFVWNGQRLCFDGSQHLVAVTDRAAARQAAAAYRTP